MWHVSSVISTKLFKSIGKLIKYKQHLCLILIEFYFIANVAFGMLNLRYYDRGLQLATKKWKKWIKIQIVGKIIINWNYAHIWNQLCKITWKMLHIEQRLGVDFTCKCLYWHRSSNLKVPEIVRKNLHFNKNCFVWFESKVDVSSDSLMKLMKLVLHILVFWSLSIFFN